MSEGNKCRFGSFSAWLRFLIFFSLCFFFWNTTELCGTMYQSSSWTYSSAQVWFSPFFLFQYKEQHSRVWTSENKRLYLDKPHKSLTVFFLNKALSIAVQLRPTNGSCMNHLNPYNNTVSFTAILRFPRFPCRDTALSGFSHSTDVICTNKHSWVWHPAARNKHRTYCKVL